MATSTTFSIDLSSLDGSNGFRLDGATAFDFSGLSVSNAGDVNGDGFDDVIVGASRTDPNGNASGSSYVVFGKAAGFDAAMDLSSLDGDNGFRLDGVAADDYSGKSVSNAGDVNGDGFDDLIIGAYLAEPNGRGSGSSYVVFGKANGFDAAMDLSSLDGDNGFRLDGADTYDGSGFSVSSAGDVNGDGFDDVIVGVRYADPSGDNSGSSYVVFGKASGFSATMDLSSLDGNNGFSLDGGTEQDVAGFSVSGAGDVNGDGFDDVIFGARYADPNGDNSGSSYVVFGQASGFDVTLDLSSLDGSNGFRLDGVAARDRSGGSVSSAGDVNDDGFDDLIVGASGADPNGDRSGSSYVVFGRASGFGAAINLSSLDGSNGFRLDGVAAFDYSGASVSGAGDVNGDGFADLLVGAVGTDPNGTSYVVFGRASGFDAEMDLSSPDGDNGFRVVGSAFYSLGYSVSAAGDVNGDGFDDLIVGAPFASPNGDNSGSSFVIFGSRNITGTVTYVGTSGDDVLTGTSAAEIFEAADGNDIMTGGGGADVFRESGGDDTMQVADLNFQLVDGGFGTDTLSLGASGLNLNLASFSEKVKNIEAVDLTGSGNNTLNLTAINLFGLSDTSDTLVVNGNAGDRVTGLNGGWTDDGIQSGFRTFTQGAATLLIDADVSTDPPAGGIINLSSLNGSNGFRLHGVAAGDRLGQSVSNAGDVNGDGFDDVIVGASRTDPNGNASGSSYVVFGKAAGFDAAMNLSSLDGDNGFRLDGVAADDYSGGSVSSAGDINGDGFDDVIVGAPLADPNGDRSGSSYVVFGRASGFDASMSLSDLDGSNGFRLDGLAERDFLGLSVSSAGDVNGDGFDDVIIGSNDSADTSSSTSTIGYLVFGSDSGFSPALNLSSLDGSNGFHLDVDAYNADSTSVSSAGDINGDGFDDLVIDYRLNIYTFRSYSESYVVFGKASGFDAALDLSSLDGSDGFLLTGVQFGPYSYSGGALAVSDAGDVNGDGFDDLIVGSPSGGSSYYAGVSYVVFGKASGFSDALDVSRLDGSNGFRLDGLAAGDRLGQSVSAAGDVNGDGFDDVIVGALGANSSYVVFGKSSGFDATVNLSTFGGSNGVRLDGGSSVSSAGDVNGDGFDDLLVGADGTNANGEYSGSSYVIFGRSDFSGDGDVIQGTPGDDNLKGTAAAEIFEAGAGDDSMIGRGGADVFHGGAGNDDIRVSDLSFGLVDGGSGKDALHLAGSDLNLVLASVGDKISGIETICLFGRGDNTLTLTAADLLNLSDTTNTLKVHGNAGDHIVGLSSGWTDGGIRPNGYFHTYTQGDAVLLVGTNLTTDFV